MRRHQHKIFAMGFIAVLWFGVGVWEAQEQRELVREGKLDYLIDMSERQRQQMRKLELANVEMRIELIDMKIDKLSEEIAEKLDALHAKVDDRIDMDEYERGWDEAMEACEAEGQPYQEPPC